LSKYFWDFLRDSFDVNHWSVFKLSLI
jgi:hypothetical protein